MKENSANNTLQQEIIKEQIEGNTWTGTIIMYPERYINWTRIGLGIVRNKTRKLMTFFKVLHARDDINR